MSSLIVQKYGGTSVGTIDRIKRVARKIADIKDSGKDVMVVVSAMAGQTDQLMSMAREISNNPKSREIDLLLSSGERISSALLTIALIMLPGAPLNGMGARFPRWIEATVPLIFVLFLVPGVVYGYIACCRIGCKR